MPEIPVILPLIIAGLLFGSLLKAGTKKIPRRGTIIASVISGLANAGQAYVMYLVTPRTTATNNFSGTFAAAVAARQQASVVEFVFTSFVVGVLVVLLLFFVAWIVLRRGREPTEEEEEEFPELEEPKLKPKSKSG